MHPWMHSPRAAAALFIAVLATAGPAHAVVTSTLTVETYKDFDKGEAEAAFITSLGEVRPGWDTERTDLGVGGVWSSALAPDGTLFLGTDDDGSIYRVAKGKAEKLASIDSAVAIVSLARAADGTLYAGTMPAGEIWRIDSATGKATKLAGLDQAESVWALALAADGATLYAGTGPAGKLFSVDTKSGTSSPIFDTEDKRVTALLVARDGSVWLGTSEKALVFRYEPKTRTARAIADFAGNEISALADAGDSVIASVNDFDEPITSGIKTKAQVDKAQKTGDKGEAPKLPQKGEKPGADERPTESAEPERQRARKGKGALYRLYGDGRSEQMHALTATYFTALAALPEGQVFAGAGDKGRVYLIDTDQSVSTALDVEERIIAALHHQDGRLVFATSDAAAVYRTTGSAAKASYLSEVFDTNVPSHFGKILWHARGNVTLETRSGNTAEPGIGWSEFSAPRDIKPGGGQTRSARITSPIGRYVQFRAKFSGEGDALHKARLYYLPHNRPTQVQGIEVKPEAESKGVTLATGAVEPRSPAIKLSWNVDNPDDDATSYRVEVRREGDVIWRPIATEKKPFTATKYSWNTETFPDGWYRVRVSASDERANSSDRARTTSQISPLFLVDNQKPVIDGVSVSYPSASARAFDAMSPIAEMAYAVDDGPWRVGTCNDGIFDDTTEMLRMDLPRGLEPGIHTLAIRVADEAGNIGAASVTFRVDK